MTGPEHYREAERLIASVMNTTVSASQGMATITMAQAHATLAHAAAIIDQHRSPDSKVAAAWDEVTR